METPMVKTKQVTQSAIFIFVFNH